MPRSPYALAKSMDLRRKAAPKGVAFEMPKPAPRAKASAQNLLARAEGRGGGYC
jgi:hypothetical protein